MVPPPGVAAEFAFDEGGVIVSFDAGVRTGGDNGVTVHADNIPQREISFNYTTIWGVPADPSHNYYRVGEECEGLYLRYSCPSSAEPKPLLTLPTSCGGRPEFSEELLSVWHDPNYVAIARGPADARK